MAMTFKTNLVPDQNLVRELGSSTAKWKINGVNNPSLINFYGTCTTAADIAQKDVTLIDNADMFVLETGAIVRVKIANANSAANPTLKVGSTDAKPIMRFGTTAASTIANSSWESGSIITFVYDGTNWLMADFALRRNDNTIPSAYCSTAAATAAKVASCSGYALLSKSYIHVIITTSNTVQGALTMNINSKGAKPIYINGTASSASNYTLPAGSYLVYYDGTNYYFRTDGKLTADITGSAGSVAWSNITNKPTTISGYGITDAKINNGVITLGSNTITPLTASSTLDATKLSGTIPTSCYTDTNNAVTQTATSTSADYEVLFSATADNTTRTEGARKNSNLKFNPSTGNLTVTQINGVTVGSAPKFTDTVTTVTTSGSGNAITAISASNGVITATKGTTFLTSHQDISGKVNKTGDTMSGNLIVQKASAPEIISRDSTTNGLAISLLVGSGHQSHGIYSTGYATDVNLTNNTYTASGKWLVYRDKTGEVILNGTANKATADSSGNNIVDTYVNKTGDTMTGNLVMSGVNVVLKSGALSNSTNPSALSYGPGLNFYDKDSISLGYMQSAKYANGNQGLFIGAQRKDGDTASYNTLRLLVDTSGNGVISVSHPAAWREGLNVVNKSGDTMDGNLTISTNDNPNIRLKNADMDITASSLSTSEYNSLYFRDKNDNNIAYIQNAQVASDGHSYLQIAARTLDSSNNAITNYFTLHAYKDGSRSVVISHPAAWRSALGAVNKAGDTMTGSLSINKGTNPDNNTLGHGITISHDSEGGNITIYSGNANTYGSYLWENDAYNGDLRWYNVDSTGAYKGGVRIQKDNVVFFGAAWNDYAEMRNVPEANDYGINEQQSKLAGHCVYEIGDDTMALTTKRLQRGCKIISDTFGFNIGETEDCKTPIAVSGRALVYLYEDRELARQYIGWPVCSGPNGTVSIMTEEEEEKYPSRIVGTISAVPDYEEWGTGKVKVNGRIWIYVK